MLMSLDTFEKDGSDDDVDKKEEHVVMVGRGITTVSIVLATDVVEVIIRLRESMVDNAKDDTFGALGSFSGFICSAQVVTIRFWY